MEYYISIKGAKQHNLKNIEVSIPKNKLTVITGVSGSGKSTLAFDVLYAEGQHRYLENFSPYIRQFLNQLDKPQVDEIKGISPTIALEQKVHSGNPRSTVGTITEVYEYLKILFARIGKPISPKNGKEIKKHTTADVVDFIKQQPEGDRFILIAQVSVTRSIKETLEELQNAGFSRIKINGQIKRFSDVLQETLPSQSVVELVIDRFQVAHSESFYSRVAEAIELTYFEGEGILFLEHHDTKECYRFSNFLEEDGQDFLEPSIQLFSFNSPHGACPVCQGYGDILDLDESLIIPNEHLSIYEGAVQPWDGQMFVKEKSAFMMKAEDYGFSIHKPYRDLTQQERDLLWEGNEDLVGIRGMFKMLERKSHKIQNRVMLSRYRSKQNCTACLGQRLRAETHYIRINGHNLTELVAMPIEDLAPLFETLKLSKSDQEVAKVPLREINQRLSSLNKIGLGYLTLGRSTNTLSGGELQRLNLIKCIGNSLTGSIYILDEPSIGLHPRNTEDLIESLKALRDKGNTVVVVEHDEAVMQAADHILDIGPRAGVNGGQVVGQGDLKSILKQDTLTAGYLSGRYSIEPKKHKRNYKYYIEVKGAKLHNLKHIDVTFPLETLTVVTGVSGSGKTTLVKEVLYPNILRTLQGGRMPNTCESLEGHWEVFKNIELVDQNPVSKSSRSNAATYLKIYDDIRLAYASTLDAKQLDFSPKHFSFNVAGGRCEKCQGAGMMTIDMQFMTDVVVTCDACGGKRFNKEVLSVLLEGKNISEVLTLTVSEAISFFGAQGKHKIVEGLLPLEQVGLEYLSLGQSTSTLSGGEAQRLKLASFLKRGNTTEKTIFIFDEPTTGLHFDDVKKLLIAFDQLVEKGHSIITIEHHVDVIKYADYVIDLGLDSGDHGGELIFFGTPEALAKHDVSKMASYLKEKIN